MSLLYVLEGLRSPILNYITLFFSGFTSELFFICVTSIIFWCFSKKAAYKIIFSFCLSANLIAIINMIIREPFPFQQYSGISSLEIIETNAAGYSMPSIGLFLASVLCFGIVVNNSNFIVKGACILIEILVVFSYLYLSMCTIWSAAISIILGGFSAFIFSRFVDMMLFELKQYHIYLIIAAIPMFILLCVSAAFHLNGLIDLGAFSGYLKICGLTVGFLISWFFESTILKFNIRTDKASKQLLKAVIGTAGNIIIWAGLYFLLSCFDNFWPRAFLCNLIVSLGAYGAYPIFIQHFFAANYNVKR